MRISWMLFLTSVSKADLEKNEDLCENQDPGIGDAEEFEDLQKVFNRYPFAEVIIHPRVRSDFIKNQPNRQVFGEFLKESVNPVCYNGDIFTVSDAAELKAEFPELESIMCGRRLLSNPALVRELQGGEALKKKNCIDFMILFMKVIGHCLRRMSGTYCLR